MNIDLTYQELIAQLKTGKRPFVELSKDEVAFLCQRPKNDNLLRPWLAILGYSRKNYFEFQTILIDFLHTEHRPELLVFALSAFQKHVIEFYHRKGERFPLHVIEALKIPLRHSNSEVVDWTLKMIEQLGPQRALLTKVLRERIPELWKCFSPRQFALRHRIGVLLSRL